MCAHKVVVEIRDAEGRYWSCGGVIADIVVGQGDDRASLSNLKNKGQIYVTAVKIVVEE